MISADQATRFREGVLSGLLDKKYSDVLKEKDDLCLLNREYHGNADDRIGFLVGSRFYVLAGLRNSQTRLIKRQGIHPKLSQRAQLMDQKHSEILSNKVLVKQSIEDLIREGDTAQHVRDMIPDSLINHLSMFSVLPSRSVPEADLEKMGATGANFSLLRRLADEMMVYRLLKG